MRFQDDTYVALVTGATGLVGRHIVQHLAAQVTGWKVLAVVRDGEGLDYEEAEVLGKNVECIQVGCAGISRAGTQLAGTDQAVRQ